MTSAKRRKATVAATDVTVVDAMDVTAVTAAAPVPAMAGPVTVTEVMAQIVTPGEVITKSDSGFMRGHGTFVEGGMLIASVAGVVERVNKLISVRPLQARYTGEIGDVVVCRVVEVAQRRWKVDTNARQDAVLLLSSINLPGGVQRRKSEEDELNMRRFYEEGDLLSAKVESLFQDGAISLHTRSMKYGKLKNGTMVVIPPALVKRSPSHFVTLPSGVDVILGLNGYIWVSRHSKAIEAFNNNEEASELNTAEDDHPIEDTEREAIARTCNSIRALASKFMYVYETSITAVYERSLEFAVKDMLHEDTINLLVSEAQEQINQLEAAASAAARRRF